MLYDELVSIVEDVLSLRQEGIDFSVFCICVFDQLLRWPTDQPPLAHTNQLQLSKPKRPHVVVILYNVFISYQMQLNICMMFEQNNFALLWEQMMPEDEDFKAFAKKRHDGAAKIVKMAKQKGGAAMLTYHHFKVKLPHYNKAMQGKFKVEEAKKQLKDLTKELNAAINSSVKMQQIEFQKKVGLIEVLGELIIKAQS